MGWFMARTYDWAMKGPEAKCLSKWRRELIRDLAGDVLEIGAGTGVNLACYTSSVTRLVVTEPDPHMRAKLEAKRGGEAPGSVEVVATEAESLPFDDESFDAVVATLVLCSVGDVAQTLAEIHRVLRPGGKLAFLEHVAADDNPDRLRWQIRLEPIWKCLQGNCHLTRRPGAAIVEAGLRMKWTKCEEVGEELALVRTNLRGIAIKPESGSAQ